MLTCQSSPGKGQDWLGSWNLLEYMEFWVGRFKQKEGRSTSHCPLTHLVGASHVVHARSCPRDTWPGGGPQEVVASSATTQIVPDPAPLFLWNLWIEPPYTWLQWLAAAPGSWHRKPWCGNGGVGFTCRLQGAWSQRTVCLAVPGVGFLGMVSGFSLFSFLCFVEVRSLEPGSSLLPQIVQHLNKDLFPSPSTFVFGICLGLMMGSWTPLLFGNNMTFFSWESLFHLL